MSRTDDVTAARAAADEWAAARALPPSGGYSGSWYINGYLGGWWPADWVYWMADYSIPPELLPMRPVHQFSSTPIDQDAMLESEIVTSAPVPTPAADRETPTDWPWASWEEAADNFKGIADSLGVQLAAANAALAQETTASATQATGLAAQLKQTATDRDTAVAARNVALNKISKAKAALA